MNPSHSSFFIGVAGGSGSGKTTVTHRVIEAAGQDGVAVINQDNYYCAHSSMSFEQRLQLNYDHPDAFYWTLLSKHIDQLMAGQAIEMPEYDFSAYTRSQQTTPIQPGKVIVLEGFFSLYNQELRNKMHLKVFVDADADVRFIRRLQRDTQDRGRSTESVIEQYLQQVRPMHLSFVEPTKRYADVIIPHGGMNEPALDMLVARIKQAI